MSHMKPSGYWKCRACGNVCQGEQLVQDPSSTALKWTCSDYFCGGTCDNLDPKFIVTVLNQAAQPRVQPTLLTLCRYCERVHDNRVACPEYVAKSQSG